MKIVNCVQYMCNHSSCKMHEKLHELLVAASSMRLCVKLPCVCVCVCVCVHAVCREQV